MKLKIRDGAYGILVQIENDEGEIIEGVVISGYGITKKADEKEYEVQIQRRR